MNPALCLDTAGLTFGIELPAAAWQAPVVERYAAFVSSAAAAWHVTVTHDPALGFTARALGPPRGPGHNLSRVGSRGPP